MDKRGAEGGGEGRRGKEGGRGGESQRSSPNSELPLSQRGAEWLTNWSVRTPPPPSRTQREKGMRVEEKGFPPPFKKENLCVEPRATPPACSEALPVTVDLPLSLKKEKKKNPPSTHYFLTTHRPLSVLRKPLNAVAV
jgi:hypothetical protein